MEIYNITETENGLNIDGIPDAVAIVKADGRIAQRISDLSLHKTELFFALDCVTLLESHKTHSTLSEALWNTAITSFCKCFGRGVRSPLSERKILKNRPPEALEAFRYFQTLRNKHLIHDENSYSQSLPGAVINNGSKAYKIEKIVCFNARSVTNTKENRSNLNLLITDSIDWVLSEFDNLSTQLTIELEKETYKTLSNRPPLNYSAPKLEEINKPRGKH